MNESVARVFDRILRGLGLKTLNAQFLLSYALMRISVNVTERFANT
ncbi:hypothetical protein AAAC10_13300 [Pseudomonas aeruginosa]